MASLVSNMKPNSGSSLNFDPAIMADMMKMMPSMSSFMG